MEGGKMSNEVEVVQAEATGIMAWAEGLKVQSRDDYQGAIAELGRIKATRAKIVEYWAGAKAAAYSAWKQVVAKEKQMTDICDKAERMVKDKALAWKGVADRLAAKEAAKAQAIADEKARRERERLEREAAKLKTPEKVAERLAEAEMVQAPVVAAADPTAGVQGAATRKTWKGEVTDLAALLQAAVPGSVAAGLVMANQKAIDGLARATKGVVSVPGVRFYAVETLAIGGKSDE
jgi:hypothetical protein